MFRFFAYILKLHRENILYKRVVVDLISYIKNEHQKPPVMYGLGTDEKPVGTLYILIKDLKNKQKPTDNANNSDNSRNNLP